MSQADKLDKLARKIPKELRRTFVRTEERFADEHEKIREMANSKSIDIKTRDKLKQLYENAQAVNYEKMQIVDPVKVKKIDEAWDKIIKNEIKAGRLAPPNKKEYNSFMKKVWKTRKPNSNPSQGE